MVQESFLFKNSFDVLSAFPGEVDTSLTDEQTDNICMIIVMYVHIMYSMNLKHD